MGAASGYCHSFMVLHYMTVIFIRTAVIIFCILEITGIDNLQVSCEFSPVVTLTPHCCLTSCYCCDIIKSLYRTTNKTNAPVGLKFLFLPKCIGFTWRK